MSDKIYTLVVHCGTRPAPNDAIERVLDSAKDWLRFSPGTYFFRSDQLADFWYDLLKPILQPEDQIIVMEAQEENRKGWLLPLSLEWFTTRRHSNRAGL